MSRRSKTPELEILNLLDEALFRVLHTLAQNDVGSWAQVRPGNNLI